MWKPIKNPVYAVSSCLAIPLDVHIAFTEFNVIIGIWSMSLDTRKTFYREHLERVHRHSTLLLLVIFP